MTNKDNELLDLAVQAGPPPEGIDITTWLIAEVPPVPLTRAARWHVPSYETLVQDKHKGGNLIEYLNKTPLPERALGEEILLTQQRLSGPNRRLASFACALTVFAGTAAYSEHSLRETNQNDNLPQNLLASDKAVHWEGDAIFAIPAGLMSGLLASMVALGFSNRLAVKPARRIVRKSQDSSS